ncbi:MAG: hypothetical protein AAF431_04175 [Pseudomonadota bacterium]
MDINWISTLRDIGLILGVPTIGLMFVRFYNQQIQILKSQVSTVKETQYANALTQLKSQKELFELERNTHTEKISDLEKRLYDAEQSLENYLTRALSAEAEVKSKSENILTIERCDSFVWEYDKADEGTKEFFNHLLAENRATYWSMNGYWEDNLSENDEKILSAASALYRMGLVYFDSGCLREAQPAIIVELNEKGRNVGAYLKKITQ